MLALQYFKKSVCETVLGVLARTGRVDAVLYVLRMGGQGEPDLMQFPLSVDQLTTVSASGHSEAMVFAARVMKDKEYFISCITVPQYLIRYYVEGRLQQQYRPFIYDEKGNFTADVEMAYRVADDDHVTITPVLTLTFEYPVGEVPAKVPAKTLWAYDLRNKMETVYGCTYQVIFLKPHHLGVGYAFDSAMEVGSEYAHTISDLVGRGLRGGHYVEQTRYRNTNPWQLTSSDMLAVLQGTLQAIPLPDVSRFPTPPMSKEPPAASESDLDSELT